MLATISGSAILFLILGPWLMGAMRRRRAAEREAILRAERERIGREFHDILAQGLTGILMHAEAALHEEELQQVRTTLRTVKQLARRTFLDSKRVLLDLRPDMLEHGGLADALRRMLAIMTDGLPVQGSVEVKGLPRGVDRDVESHLFRIAQEAATNALRHSRALRIDIVLSYSSRHVRLAVADDGRGSGEFRLDEIAAASNNGFRGMRERADAMGAFFETQHHPGRGMEIVVQVEA